MGEPRICSDAMNGAAEGLQWFAMRAPFHKEMEAQKLLDKLCIENFIPMCHKVVVRRGKKHREWVPAVHNLVFVRTTHSLIQRVKQADIPFLQYVTRPEAGRNIPIIVPDVQMAQFMAVARAEGEKLIYLTPDDLSHLGKGTRVRVLGGPFDGVEGIFLRVKGCRSRRVVLQIQGILAVALAEIETDLIEVLD